MKSILAERLGMTPVPDARLTMKVERTVRAPRRTRMSHVARVYLADRDARTRSLSGEEPWWAQRRENLRRSS